MLVAVRVHEKNIIYFAHYSFYTSFLREHNHCILLCVFYFNGTILIICNRIKSYIKTTRKQGLHQRPFSWQKTTVWSV